MGMDSRLPECSRLRADFLYVFVHIGKSFTGVR